MNELEGIKCNLEIAIPSGKNECRAICLRFFDDRCCKYCEELSSCKRVCGLIRDLKKGVIK